ncbi:four helix bundle protein [Larkinella sp. C7]|jgi:four helix bundle protein|uniref:four helix bundle protein n=1 Tax=Larkinella sp. C7 TaxID=2576607 RepID=UPI0011112ADE|nr:four helix bundle protein [Larkinella sp. C7]
METHNFRNLKVWQLSVDFVTAIYQLTPLFPNDEKFGLSSQIKRSAVSIPSNIAEGSGRGSNKEFARFLSISLASSYELETQLIVANRLNFLTETIVQEITRKLHEIQKMIFSLHKKFES